MGQSSINIINGGIDRITGGLSGSFHLFPSHPEPPPWFFPRISSNFMGRILGASKDVLIVRHMK